MQKEKMEQKNPETTYKKETVDKVLVSIFIFTALAFLLIFYMEYKSRNITAENAANSVQIQRLIEERDRLQEEIRKAKEQNQN